MTRVPAAKLVCDVCSKTLWLNDGEPMPAGWYAVTSLYGVEGQPHVSGRVNHACGQPCLVQFAEGLAATTPSDEDIPF